MRLADEQKKETNAAAFHDRIRKRIVDEDNVINHRMMWSTLAQTSLFTAFGISSIERIDVFRLGLSLAIALIGFTTAILTQMAITAARNEIASLIEKYMNYNALHYTGIQLGIDIIADPKNHKDGHRLPAYMPGLIMALWGCAVLYILLKFSGAAPTYREWPLPFVWQAWK